MRLNQPMRKQLLLISLCAALWSCGGSGTTSNPEPPPTGPAVGTPVPNEGWVHVTEGSVINYQHNPPASGPHYPVWLRYQEYTTVQARGYWVHNLEHGAIVFLYRPDAPPASVAASISAIGSPRCIGDPDTPRPTSTPTSASPISPSSATWASTTSACPSIANPSSPPRPPTEPSPPTKMTPNR